MKPNKKRKKERKKERKEVRWAQDRRKRSHAHIKNAV